MERLGAKSIKSSLEELGLAPDTLASSDRRVSHRAAIDLLKESIRVTGRTDLGILAAAEVESGELGGGPRCRTKAVRPRAARTGAGIHRRDVQLQLRSGPLPDLRGKRVRAH